MPRTTRNPNQKETQGAMTRKPILMHPDMIRRVDRMAAEEGVSFAEIVRRAVDSYDPELANTDDAILEALADALIESTKSTVVHISNVEQKLDHLHAELETRKYGTK